MMKHFSTAIFFKVLLLGVLFSASSCRDDVERLIPPTEIGKIVTEKALDFRSGGGLREVVLETDVDFNSINYSVSSNAKDWCLVEAKDGKLFVNLKSNRGEKRITVLTLSTTSGLRQDVGISQENFSIPQQGEGTRVQASTAKVLNGNEQLAPDAQGNPQVDHADYHPAMHAIDGKTSTFYHSVFGETVGGNPDPTKRWPIVLEIGFDEAVPIDYMTFIPRQDDGLRWGMLGKFNLYVSTTDTPAFTKINELPYDAGQKDLVSFTLTLAKALKNVKSLRVEILSGMADRASLAELEFYSIDKNDSYDPLEIFTDLSCSEIKGGVTDELINNIPEAFYKDIALSLKAGNYEDKEFRIRKHRPYQDPAIMRDKNRNWFAYSVLDNPTGMYVLAGEETTILVGDQKGQTLSLRVQDYEGTTGNDKNGFAGTYYTLQEGVNIITPSKSGLAYVVMLSTEDYPLNPTTDAEKNKIAEKSVNVHFVSGHVNGLYDKKVHTAADSERLLANAKYKEFDVVGDYAHLIWVTSHFKEYNTDLSRTIDNLDNLVKQEMELAGLYKYNRIYKNRLLFVISYTSASPNASTNRTLYTASYKEVFANPDRFAARIWGPGHEAGHVNQLLPDMKWAGLTEATNNLFTLYVQQQIGEPVKLLVDDFYRKATVEIIDGKLPHAAGTVNEYRTVAFWQLQLYFAEAKGNKDFYGDVHEHFRTNVSSPITKDGTLQLNFVRVVCNIAKLDLTDFFTKWGFLRPVDLTINDYGTKKITITQAQVDALVAEIKAKGYPEPAHDITKITDANIADFK